MKKILKPHSVGTEQRNNSAGVTQESRMGFLFLWNLMTLLKQLGKSLNLLKVYKGRLMAFMIGK
jgi:hypothetical protein